MADEAAGTPAEEAAPASEAELEDELDITQEELDDVAADIQEVLTELDELRERLTLVEDTYLESGNDGERRTDDVGRAAERGSAETEAAASPEDDRPPASIHRYWRRRTAK